ncbi:hypothetical protein N0V88_005530 [Collariella sp. IMI 366227]|nr:hypothetical protein N0V88_005530 [Collariella sp. IMI 366227]
MGKPGAPLIPGIAGGSSDTDAVSLHTQPGDRMFDDDVPELQSDDLPPLYSDIEPEGANAPLLPNLYAPSYVSDAINDGRGWFTTEPNTGLQYIIHPSLDTDPKLLEHQIRRSATKPPRPYVRIEGTHTKHVRENGKDKQQSVTDFDVSLELTPYLFSDAVRGLSWKALRSVDNNAKTRRGTIFRKRAPLKERDPEASKPTLAEWCHRYCASHSPIKSFVLEREVTGFDQGAMKRRLEALVRGTNYRGTVNITFPVKDAHVIIYNDCKANRWRLTAWITWMCYLTFMWLFTWPVLFFTTKRFEVAVAEWPFSVMDLENSKSYVSMSEDHIYNLWGRAICRAVLDRRQGALNQEDLIASQTAPAEPFGNLLEGAPRFLRNGINAIQAVNRQLGWGESDY